jgi:hypothetical protein
MKEERVLAAAPAVKGERKLIMSNWTLSFFASYGGEENAAQNLVVHGVDAGTLRGVAS